MTPDGETVWEYVNPFTVPFQHGTESNAVFRCERYDSTDPALQGRNLGGANPRTTGFVAPQELALLTQDRAQPQGARGGQQPGERRVGPPGIASITPTSATAGDRAVEVWITLDQRFAPPEHVRPTRISIGSA